MPPTALATTGTPALIASSVTRGVPSLSEGTTSTSSKPIIARASKRKPRKCTSSCTPSCSTYACNSFLWGPSPMTRKCTSGKNCKTWAAASRKYATPFSGWSRAATPTRSPLRKAAGKSGCMLLCCSDAGGRAFIITEIRSEGTPSCSIRRRRISLDTAMICRAWE